MGAQIAITLENARLYKGIRAARDYARSNEEHGKVERHREVNRGDRLAIVGQAANRRQRETGQQHPLLTD
ncbi:MAG: hypothetical protein KJ734_07785, partial [Chloroflexi bacterium]|nr:hypothetical protein [Chloroflexota bacterium]